MAKRFNLEVRQDLLYPTPEQWWVLEWVGTGGDKEHGPFATADEGRKFIRDALAGKPNNYTFTQ